MGKENVRQFAALVQILIVLRSISVDLQRLLQAVCRNTSTVYQ